MQKHKNRFTIVQLQLDLDFYDTWWQLIELSASNAQLIVQLQLDLDVYHTWWQLIEYYLHSAQLIIQLQLCISVTDLMSVVAEQFLWILSFSS